MHNYNFIYIYFRMPENWLPLKSSQHQPQGKRELGKPKRYYFMNIEQEKVVLRIMNLVLANFSLLPCGLKHTQFFLFIIWALKYFWYEWVFVYINVTWLRF